MMPIHPEAFVAYTLAVVSGAAFGFVLERAGFGDARRLAAQFYLTDMRVLKVMFSAIVTAAVGLALLRVAGALDMDAVYINPTFLGAQIVGGVIFGVGFVVAGHCPGTAVVSAVNGRINGIVFLVGAGTGALGYAVVYDKIARFATAGGGRRTLDEWLGVSYGTATLGVVVLAMAFFVGAEWVERFMARRNATTQATSPAPARARRFSVRDLRPAVGAAAIAMGVIALAAGPSSSAARSVAHVPDAVEPFAVARELSLGSPDVAVIALDQGRHPLRGAISAAQLGASDEEIARAAPNTRIVIVAADAPRADRLARRLAGEGRDVRVLTGGVDAWDRAMDADPPPPAPGAGAVAWDSHRANVALRRSFGDATSAPAAVVAPAVLPAAAGAAPAKKREGC